MAESRDDVDVDAIIADMQAQLDKLKAAQRKDVQDETAEENKEVPQQDQIRGESPRERIARVRAHVRRLKA